MVPCATRKINMKIQEKFDLTGCVGVVTGGGGQLGAEFCRTLAEAGAAVAVVDLNASASQAVADTLTNSEYKALAIPTDITQPDSVNAAVEKVLSTFGRLDILVNSAALDPKFDPDAINKGITPGAFEDYPLDLWNSALDVNLTGMFLVTKAGVMGFTKYLAAYYAETEIRVNALTPGGVFNNHEDYFVKNYSAKTILGRMAKKDEMNGALLFLASDASSYMTGNNVVVDGGWTAW